MKYVGVFLKVVLNWILKKKWKYGLYSAGSKQQPVAASCEHGDDPLSCISGGELFDHLRY